MNRIIVLSKLFLLLFRRTIPLLVVAIILAGGSLSTINAQEAEEITERRISVSEFKDKMMGGWIGQMVGVGWGAPTEFRWVNQIIPDEDVPEWKPEMVNVWNQDDLYVEMTFLRSLEEHGLDVSLRQAGLDFAHSKYMLWHANVFGRSNLRDGIAPPDCSHPQFSAHADDIDYQIEADYSGLISPGMPNAVIALGEKFGRLMNYGDGLYAGQFVGGMYAEAFFETDPHKIIEAGLACIPAESQYAEMVRDVVQWHAENPDDWKAAWQKINEKYQENPDYRRWSCSGPDSEFNIDAKINGAYILMGMLYGKDLDEVIIISMQCGQDSDCNPSNAGGVLATAVGYKNLPEKYVSGLENDEKFSYTEYDFPGLIDVCVNLAREQIIAGGGKVEKNEEGEEVFVIPVQKPVPSEFDTSWDPGPIAGSVFTSEDLPHITWTVVFNIAIWVILALAIVALPENRNLKALLILIPVASAFLLWELAVMLIPKDAFEFLGVQQTIFVTQAVGIAILFLLGDRLGKTKGIISAILALIILSGVGLVGIFTVGSNYFDDWTGTFLSKYLLAAVVLILSLFLVSKLSRKKYGNLRFALLLLLSITVIQLFTALIPLSVMWGFSIVFQYITYFLLVSIASAILFYLITLPFWILSFNNETYNQRFKNLLKLPENSAQTIND